MAQTYVTKHPGIVGDKPAIAGTRIKVSQIALNYLGAGNSVAEILRRYPHLTPAQVHSALAYFYDHPDEIISELFDELATIRDKLTESEMERLRDQMVPLILEGFRFSDIYNTPEQAREESGVYLLLRERTKTSFHLLDIGVAGQIRSALQRYAAMPAAETVGIRYAVRYAPFPESQRIAEMIQRWLQQTASNE